MPDINNVQEEDDELWSAEMFEEIAKDAQKPVIRSRHSLNAEQKVFINYLEKLHNIELWNKKYVLKILSLMSKTYPDEEEWLNVCFDIENLYLPIQREFNSLLRDDFRIYEREYDIIRRYFGLWPRQYSETIEELGIIYYTKPETIKTKIEDGVSKLIDYVNNAEDLPHFDFDKNRRQFETIRTMICERDYIITQNHKILKQNRG